MNAPLHKVRTARQIVDKHGNPYECYATENLWVGTGEPFSKPCYGNTVTPLTTGKEYYANLIEAMAGANEEILIAGWQVNWDALLAPGVRLFDVLVKAARNGALVRVMPWDDAAPVQTYDDQTKAVLTRINDLVGPKRVEVRLAPGWPDESKKFYSHHQKQVVIDRKIAFVGGIDLAYGRFDDASYDLHADANGRAALNRYNGCVVPVGTIEAGKAVDPDLLDGPIDYLKGDTNATWTRIMQGAFQTPYDEDSPTSPTNPRAINETLDPLRQPRMPWQDVMLKIEGPAVTDLTLNFVLRWNAIYPGRQPLAVPTPAKSSVDDKGCIVQVLRSAPHAMRGKEYNALLGADRERFAKPAGAQANIAAAMATLIEKAQHFIYIENQFFVSAFGQTQGIPNDLSGPAQTANKVKGDLDQTTGATITHVAGDWQTANDPPRNRICDLLAARLDRAITDKHHPRFHVYLTLPVHPEGRLDDGAIMTQVHWTMQSLVFGSHSLLNRIRRSIKARELLDKKEADWKRAYELGNTEYEDVPIKKCFDHVTLLNLRNWDKFGERYVTEQIYVHSKLMVVDDRFALVGSANINDRSLLGTRDSELAVLLMDTDVERHDLCGNGKSQPARKVARDLRRAVWKKLFGITGNVRPANELKSAIDQPANPKSWRAIQEVAKKNTELYEAAFEFIPRNRSPINKRDPSPIWLTWDTSVRNADGTLGAKVKPMPFDKELWAKPQHNEAAVNLAQVKGFITLFPIEWTKGENNNFGYHTGVVVENDKGQSVPAKRDMQLVQAPQEARKTT